MWDGLCCSWRALHGHVQATDGGCASLCFALLGRAGLGRGRKDSRGQTGPNGAKRRHAIDMAVSGAGLDGHDGVEGWPEGRPARRGMTHGRLGECMRGTCDGRGQRRPWR